MLNGMYTATAGLVMQQKRTEVIANNLANLDTKGFKRDVATFSQYMAKASESPDDMIRASKYNKMINATTRLDNISTSFSMGYMKETSREFDFALTNPNAFFVVDTPFGIRFTRNGDFTVDSEGDLATQEGYKVLSSLTQAQPVPVTQGERFVVSDTGDILVNGVPTGKIATAEFEDTTKLQKIGSNLFAAIDTLPEDSEFPGIESGYQEGSNVNPMQEMVRII
jgi:flagellar basal-body rod protein FlgG